MSSFESLLYSSLKNDSDILPKAIANFMFREVIEDAHTKYGISQADMRDMCIEAVNRAATLEKLLMDPELKRALVLCGYSTSKWKAVDESEVNLKLQQFKELAENLGDDSK